MFKVEKGIKMPVVKGGKYPFRTMEIGDSFYCSAEVVNKVRAAAANYKRGKGPEKTFSTLKEGDGFRCWRIK